MEKKAAAASRRKVIMLEVGLLVVILVMYDRVHLIVGSEFQKSLYAAAD
jgi:hypothetical protein